jgi:nicotinic acid mononucleotide adenylyltransferase
MENYGFCKIMTSILSKTQLKDELSEVDFIEVEIETKNHPKIHILTPVVEISSTLFATTSKKEKHSAVLPTKVWEYIDHNIFYKVFSYKNSC